MTSERPTRSTKISFDPREDRRDRRYPLPPVSITIGGIEYVTINWSLGGFLLSGFDAPAQPKHRIEGKLQVKKDVKPASFTGIVVRVDEPEKGNLAVQFVDLDDGTMTMLDRTIARRLFRH
jgi:PilZ domain-containing protein